MIFKSSYAGEVKVSAGIEIHNTNIVPNIVKVPQITVPSFDISDKFACLYSG